MDVGQDPKGMTARRAEIAASLAERGRPEMLAATLPQTKRESVTDDERRLAEKALFLLEHTPEAISAHSHEDGIAVTVDLIRDYKAMLSAAPSPAQGDG